MSLLLTGLSISKGVAVGKAYVMKQGQPDVPEYEIDDHLVDSEVERYTKAVKTARTQLQEMSEKITQEVSTDIADFIESHILTLDEAAISRKPCSTIRKKKINAEWALKQQYDKLTKVFDDIDEPYLQSRKDDIIQVVNIILKILNQQDIKPIDDDENGFHSRIIIADQLSPSDLLLLHDQNIAALVSEHDAPTSHTAIMARNLGIPAITGIVNAPHYIEDGELVLVDGKYGSVCIAPDNRSVAYYETLEQEIHDYKENLKQLATKPALTLDKQKISLYANIDLSYDLNKLLQISPEGIGLYRTESLYINRDTLPDEEEQYQLYSALCHKTHGIPISIRTLDLGANTILPTIEQNNKHSNPMLGLRAIRLSLAKPDIFLTQLRAILRASAHGKIRIILPLVISSCEVEQSKKYLQQAKDELTAEEIDFDANMKVGIMIETPAAALSARTFAKQADFLAIGTNDLVQYLLAIDRTDEQVSHLYDPCHSVVLNAIYDIIQIGKQTDTTVYVCGDMASNTKYVRLLLGMGLTTFSAMPSQILEVKKHIRSSHVDNAKLFVGEILKSTNPRRIKELIDKLNQAS